jgi:hypothetical protein
MSVEEVKAEVLVQLYQSPDKKAEGNHTFFVRLSNHYDIERVLNGPSTAFQISLPFHDNLHDDYTVVIVVDGYRQFGTYVKADAKRATQLKALLIPSQPKLVFMSWEDLAESLPAAAKVFGLRVSPADAKALYERMIQEKPLAVACLLNLVAAMGEMKLAGDATPLTFLMGVLWDNTFAQDRFFGYVDAALIPLVKAAAGDGQFAPEPNPGQFHAGATCSFKQTQYDFSNVQLTFHEKDTKEIGGVTCVLFEPDMDLYKDLLAHGVLEVLPNLVRKGLTHPLDVLTLRWSDAVGTDSPLFNPGYSYTS